MCAPMLLDAAGCFDVANVSNYLGTVYVSELPNSYTKGPPYSSHRLTTGFSKAALSMSQ